MTANVKKRIGLLALHRSYGADSWTITHIPTGLAAGRYLTYRVGLAALRELAVIEGLWEYVTTAGPTDQTREAFKAAGAIVNKYRYASTPEGK